MRFTDGYLLLVPFKVNFRLLKQKLTGEYDLSIRKILKQIPPIRSVYYKHRVNELSKDYEGDILNYESVLRAIYEKGTGIKQVEFKNGSKLNIRDNIWDSIIVKEIFVDKPYVRRVNLPEAPIVVDIGGYIGDFVVYMGVWRDAARIIVYEPTIENYTLLQKNVTENSLEGVVEAVNMAVGPDKEIVINTAVSEDGEIHASSSWHARAEKRITPCRTLDEVLAFHNLSNVDLLKIDCEGAEYDIVKSASDEALSVCQNIVLEWHKIDNYSDKLQFTRDKLKKNGFELIEDLEEKIITGIRQ